MTIKDMLSRLGIEPKKSLGQNFMVQENALRQMVEAAGVTADDAVLEIGAGLGALTDLLAEQARRVIALEIDDRLVPHLRERYSDSSHVEIVQADVLQVDLDDVLGADAGQYKVAANLPYYITSAIIRLLLERPNPPQKLALTMQREVAERITAKPGDMSLLAVSVQVYGRAKIVAHLKAGNFYPRPSVQSSILRIEPYRDGPAVDAAKTEAFFRVVRAGFSQPRKQVKNCLSAGLHMGSDDASAWLEAAGIDPRRRAETLALGDWVRLLDTAAERGINV